MELNSPRKDPYSSMNTTIDELKKKGYAEAFEVMDEKTIKDKDGKEYSPEQLIIDEIHRFTGNKDWFNNQDDSFGQVDVYALNARDGTKGYIKRDSDEEGRDVIDRFLQNVDNQDSLHENYN